MKRALVFALFAASLGGGANAADAEISIDGIAYDDVVTISTNKLLLRPLDIHPDDAVLYCSASWEGSIIVIQSVAVALNSIANDAAKKNASLRVNGRKVDLVSKEHMTSPLKNEPDTVARLVTRADRDCQRKEEPKPEVVESETSKFDTPDKMQRITKALTRAKKKWEGMGDELCNSPDSCMVFVGNFQILATGGVVTVMVSSQEAIEDYVDVCSVVLAGLGNMKRRTAYSYVLQSFQDASIAGRVKYNAGECQEFCAGGHDDEKERTITWLSKKNYWTSFLPVVIHPRFLARTACWTI